jgi:signal peptidase I
MARNRKKSGGILDTIKTVIYAVLIAVAVRTFAYEPFNIPSGSMIPTLLIGDYLFVSKFSYGYSRYSLPFGLPLFSGRILFHSPRIGDVAVFRVPTDPSVDYIKRIVGLPGDTIQVKHAILYINGKPCQYKRIQDYLYHEDGTVVPVPQYTETLPDGVKHRIIQVMDAHGPLDNTPVYHVPPGDYFMMGDNRDNSADSRIAFGDNWHKCITHPRHSMCYVPAANLVGRAEIIFFSTNGYAKIWQFWRWPFTIRYDRLFHVIGG